MWLAMILLVAAGAQHTDIDIPNYLEIVSVSERPWESGPISTFVTVKAIQPGDGELVILIPYLTAKQRLPQVGDRCAFEIRNESGPPFVLNEGASEAPQIVQAFRCLGWSDPEIVPDRPANS
jgi:hypothetical protein